VQSETAQKSVKASQPPAQRKYLSLAVDVAGLPCLIVGGGRVGARKALTLAQAGALVTVLSPEVSDRLQCLVNEGGAQWIQAEYDESRLEGFTLVVAATSDPALNLAISRDAEERRILHSAVSPGRASRVIFPATCTQEEVTVAVHSNGRDCSESKAVRDEIARVLLKRERRPVELVAFGARRDGLPASVWNALASYADPDSFTLATCHRWEIYAFARSPRAFGAEARHRLHEQTGILAEKHGEAFYIKQGVAAYHHLLRVASGLDSPLRGETDIIGQVRQGLARSAGARNSPVAEIVASVLAGQKRIRVESGLAVRPLNWADAVLTQLSSRIGSLPGKRVLVVGCGRLGRDISEQLLVEGAVVLPFSRRAWIGGVDWCAARGLAARDPLELPALLPGADALVLTTELSEALGAELAERPARSDAPLVLDLAGSNRAWLRGGFNYVALSDVRRVPQSGEEAAQIAAAEKLAVSRALAWHALRQPSHDAPAVVRIGTRASRLAREQVAEVSGFLRILLPQTALEIVTMETPGDVDKSTPLPQVTEEDFFTRDLDRALLRGEIDLAVHSAKDLPKRIPEGLCVAALTPSIAPWEALVLRKGADSGTLPPGARVGVSSLRRTRRLLELHPDAIVADVRGNVPERIAQLDAGRYDALILAAAGLIRLGLHSRISHLFSTEQFPPEPGQGALALVVRANDARVRELLQPLDLGERRGLPWT